MNVSDSVVRLLHLSLTQISELTNQIERGPKQISAAEGIVKTAKQSLQDCRDAIKQKKMEADRKQLQQREREVKLRDLAGKMNAAKNNREYQTLKEQIAADEKANSVLSDEIFEASEEVDSLQSTVPGLEERVKLAEEEKTRTIVAVEKKLESLHADLRRVPMELEELENSLPSEFATEYKRLVNSRGMDALCPIDGNSCGGCYTNVTPRVLDRLRMGHPCICPSCGRMLYRPEN